MANAQDDGFDGLESIGNTRVASSHGIAAIALSLAMKYHDVSTIKDGALYQQYKLEGRNLRELHIDMVFETAVRIERHLLASPDRIAALIADAIVHGAEEEVATEELATEDSRNPRTVDIEPSTIIDTVRVAHPSTDRTSTMPGKL